jgi:hypothetical protein
MVFGSYTNNNFLQWHPQRISQRIFSLLDMSVVIAVVKHCVRRRSIAGGSLATSTKVKLEQLLSQELFRSMGMEFVFRHVLHRFHSRFVETGEIIFLQGDQIREESPIIILANGKAKVLVDPAFVMHTDCSTDGCRLVGSPSVSEEGCQCVPMHSPALIC